jgi:hypothetical protein
MQFGAWTVVKADGKRAVCRCRCGTVRAIAVDALTSGTSTSCGCAPLARDHAAARRAEAAQRQLRRDLRDWRPQR